MRGLPHISSVPPNRIPSLDGLRAISILFVLFGHLAGTIGFPVEKDFLGLSSYGVRIFFVISGYLITGILLSEIERKGDINLTKFYYRRTLRIFPPYYAFLFTIGILSIYKLLDLSFFDWVASALYITNFAQVTSWNVGHTWSLAVEEQFYLIMPAILLLGRKKAVAILVLVLFISPFVRLFTFMLFPNPDLRWVSFGFQANADALATGCLLALFRSTLDQSSFYQRLQGSLVFLIFPLLAIGLNYVSQPRIFMFFCVTTINISTALCIDWAVRNSSSFPGKVLNLRPVAYIGTLSYSLYLWQQIFLNRNDPGTLTSFPLNLILAIGLALVSFYLVERPFLTLRQKLEPKLFKN